MRSNFPHRWSLEPGSDVRFASHMPWDRLCGQFRQSNTDDLHLGSLVALELGNQSPLKVQGHTVQPKPLMRFSFVQWTYTSSFKFKILIYMHCGMILCVRKVHYDFFSQLLLYAVLYIYFQFHSKCSYNMRMAMKYSEVYFSNIGHQLFSLPKIWIWTLISIHTWSKQKREIQFEGAL